MRMEETMHKFITLVVKNMIKIGGKIKETGRLMKSTERKEMTNTSKKLEETRRVS